MDRLNTDERIMVSEDCSGRYQVYGVALNFTHVVKDLVTHLETRFTTCML